MAASDEHVFPGFLKPVLTQIFFPKPPTTFLTCFCRGERQNYAGKKVCLNRVSNLQRPGHEPDTLTTEPPGRADDDEYDDGYDDDDDDADENYDDDDEMWRKRFSLAMLEQKTL